MNRLCRNLGVLCLGLLALALLGGLPTQAGAAGIGFRNDSNMRVVVQGASAINNVVRRGQPLVVDPGKTLWDSNLPKGNRHIVIYAVQPNRILYQDVIPFQDRDLMLYIVPAGMGRVRVTTERPKN